MLLLVRHVCASFLVVPLSFLFAEPFVAGNVVVLQSGDGVQPLALMNNPASLVEFSPDGTFAQKIPLSIHIPGHFRSSADAGEASGMRITTDADGDGLTIAGFVPPFSGPSDRSLMQRSFFEAPPAIVRVNARGEVSKPRVHWAFEGIFGAISHGGESWVGVYGNVDLIHVSADESFSGIKLWGANVRPRFVDGTHGIALGYANGDAEVAYVPGLPRAVTRAFSLVTDTVTLTDFFLSMESGVAYLATSEGTVRRYDLGNGGFSHSRTFTTMGPAVRLNGLTVDLAGEVPVVYAVSDSKLYRLEDNGTTTQMEAIATAEAWHAFTGVQLAPTAEPPPLPVDRTPPALVLGGKSRFTVIRTRLNNVRLSGAVADEGGAVAMAMRIRKRGGWKPIAVVDGMWTRQVKLRGEKKLRVKIRATDASGNVAVVSRLIRRK